MPRYYLNSADNGTVAVRGSATGRLLVTVTAPAHLGFTWIAAAADDRRFVLAAVGGSGRHAVTSFYLLRLAADGRPAALTRLSYTVPAGPAGYYANSIALSPDASWLAVAIGPASGGGSGSSVLGSLASHGSLGGLWGSRAVLDGAARGRAERAFLGTWRGDLVQCR